MSPEPPLTPSADDRAFVELVIKHFGHKAFFLAILQDGGGVHTVVRSGNEVQTVALVLGATLGLMRISQGEPPDVVTPPAPKDPA